MKPRIIVVGDIMLDHSVYTTLEKIANEAPLPVFNRHRDDYSLGGCGNVAKNLNAIGCDGLYLFSVVGRDAAGETCRRLVESMGVRGILIVRDRYPTIVKQRFFCDDRMMFRCDTDDKRDLRDVSFSEDIEHILQTDHINCIVLSDYNKGVLHAQECQRIIELARKYNVFTCVDPKANIAKYIGCSLIKPNRREAYELTDSDKSASIEDVHRRIVKLTGCKYSVITLADKGISCFDGDLVVNESSDVHRITDVTGAGDIVCSLLAYYMPSAQSVSAVLRIATRIATKSVEYSGTYTLTPSDLVEPRKNVQIDQISRLRTMYPGKTIVFTNGCFDLIHIGHVELFNFCRRSGDIVVVGLNSDESVRRLKGTGRPVNSIETRRAVLESFGQIDYVVVFDDDTPYNVVQALRPHRLVKGSDYTRDQVIGKEFADEVLLFSFVDGFSSTSVIQKIVTSSTSA
jgi:D-beta-D-heptose 7-phosphate kinase/D-beta-D-heptose 1-phosphate adenosyltransferase